ncbi:MAG: acyltransferase family protein [bacterium]|nr:acyltransferase family protein [bacterium]
MIYTTKKKDSIMTEKNGTTLDWVLIAKGIGIILVVIGHFKPDGSPDYWMKMVKCVYTFHMPIFFLLSGFLYSYEKYSYPSLIKNKTKRLVFPFISIAVIFFVVKYAAGKFVTLQYPVGLKSIYALLLEPIDSYMPLLWFVYALFIIFLVYPLVRMLINNNFIILLIFILLNVIFGSKYPVFGKALVSMPFFIIGIILRENLKFREKIISGTWISSALSVVLFFTFFLLLYYLNVERPVRYGIGLLLGLSGSISVLNISLLIERKSNSGTISTLLVRTGFYSMSIYLFHTLFESAVRIGFNQVLGGLHVPFLAVAFVAVAAGIIFPLLLEKLILRKFAFTRKFILGLS